MTPWRAFVVALCVGFVLGCGITEGVLKAGELYHGVTDRLERIEGYITQLDRMFKNR